MKKVSIRFGVRISAWFLPRNLGVFVLDIPEDKYADGQRAVSEIKQFLTLVGRGDIAASIVYELR